MFMIPMFCKSWLAVVFCIILSCASVQAQVVNDDIENRLVLNMNEPIGSNTINSTVQWKCLNQDLTRSCVKFHNDQWFEFSVEEGGEYFINVSGQECKDIWGVQVLIFTGEPCVPKTYELVTCYSDGNKDDIFIRLPALSPGVKYLLNVDGYLHDLCSFAIELSDTPKGLPVAEPEMTEVEVRMNLRVAEITWEIPEDMGNELNGYEIWKRTGEQFELRAQLPHERNAMGDSRLRYLLIDTLFTDQADYRVVASGQSKRLLVGNVTARIDKIALAEAPENNITLNLDFRNGDPILIELWDADEDRLLTTNRFTFDAAKNGSVTYRIMRFREEGVHFFKVMIRNERTGKGTLQFFEK
ncbi:hypothetical protein [Fulvivirga sedimenti]|uniref:Fibronectin type-III domain-containing protein n=1 Tax=Fulvivirga sedimenti TaxID=2879465 RepID=A0A9X1KVJ3_9BACT|nr:hypothetical protein [Fulvivirga sedimenti]MCA6073760.1 hypothetical protein [Fulvivirga sedimenti]